MGLLFSSLLFTNSRKRKRRKKNERRVPYVRTLGSAHGSRQLKRRSRAAISQLAFSLRPTRDLIFHENSPKLATLRRTKPLFEIERSSGLLIESSADQRSSPSRARSSSSSPAEFLSPSLPPPLFLFVLGNESAGRSHRARALRFRGDASGSSAFRVVRSTAESISRAAESR